MSKPTGRQEEWGNMLLGMLPRAARDKLENACELVNLRRGETIFEPGPISHLYFPRDAIIGMLITMEDGSAVESGIIGREGMFPVCLFLGLPKVPYRAVVHVPGSAWRIPVRVLQRTLRSIPELSFVLMRFTAAFLAQVSVAAACNQSHTVLARFSRRLLMISDRLQSNHIVMTQQEFAQCLGVRRMTIGDALRHLEVDGLIESRRGLIILRHREGLKKQACECYERISHAYHIVNLHVGG